MGSGLHASGACDLWELAKLPGSFESELNDDSMEPFIKKGLQMVVDGLEPAMIRGILEVRLDNMAMRHKEGAEIFESAGAFAPTLGIVGTVMGLVHVLGDLVILPSLGPKIRLDL